MSKVSRSRATGKQLQEVTAEPGGGSSGGGGGGGGRAPGSATAHVHGQAAAPADPGRCAGAGRRRERVSYPGPDGSSELPQPTPKAMRAEAWHSLLGGQRFSSETWKLHSLRLRPETLENSRPRPHKGAEPVHRQDPMVRTTPRDTFKRGAGMDCSPSLFYRLVPSACEYMYSG